MHSPNTLFLHENFASKPSEPAPMSHQSRSPGPFTFLAATPTTHLPISLDNHNAASGSISLRNQSQKSTVPFPRRLSFSAPDHDPLRISTTDTSSSQYDTFWKQIKPIDTFNAAPHLYPLPSRSVLASPLELPEHFQNPSTLPVVDDDPFVMRNNAPNASYSEFWSHIRSAKPSTSSKTQSYSEFWHSSPFSRPIATSSSSAAKANRMPAPATPTSTPINCGNNMSPSRTFGTDSTNSLFSSFGNFATSNSFTMDFSFPPPESPTQKRRKDEDSPSKQERKRQRSVAEDLSPQQKLDKVFDLFREMHWTLVEFMHHTFAHKDVHRSQRHGIIVQRYLTGQNCHTVSGVLDAWLTSSDGAGHDYESLMFNPIIPFINIGHVRPALTSFAAQIVEGQLIQEAQRAVKRSSGLHASIGRKSSTSTVQWSDLGASLMQNVKSVLTTLQPLTYHYLLRVAEPKLATRHGVVAVQQYRPPELVYTFLCSFIAISSDKFP